MDYLYQSRLVSGRGALDPGELTIQTDGLLFKSSKMSKVLYIGKSDIESIEWLKGAQGYGMKVIKHDGNLVKFDGFKEIDLAELKSFFLEQFHQEVKEVEYCMKGWNWGVAMFHGSLLKFMVESTPAFEISLEEVSQVIAGKNEVTLEFHQAENAPLSMLEMRFYIPDKEEGEEDPVAGFKEEVMTRANIRPDTGDVIVSFAEIQSLRPRGRFTIKTYPTFLQLHGKTHDYRIPYTTVTQLFLLPHNNERQVFFVLGLDPPIQQGQTRHHFIIFVIPIKDQCSVTLTKKDEPKQVSGALYKVFSRVLQDLVGKMITVAESFQTKHAISCTNHATNGLLFPMENGLIFIHKPTICIQFKSIAFVNFARVSVEMEMTKSFDFIVKLKDGKVHHFSNIMKEDYGCLYRFVCAHQIQIIDSNKLSLVDGCREERDSEEEDSDFVASDKDLEEEDTDVESVEEECKPPPSKKCKPTA